MIDDWKENNIVLAAKLRDGRTAAADFARW